MAVGCVANRTAAPNLLRPTAWLSRRPFDHLFSTEGEMAGRRLTRGLLVFVLAGCGGDAFLDKDTVTDLPSGTASGSSFSGEYDIEIYTSDCSGSCPLLDYDWFTYTICDVGMKDDDEVELAQTDGRLQVDSDGGLPVTRLTGGIDADGWFDAGGWATQEGGDVEIVARVQGTIAADGSIDATAHLRADGKARGETIACRGVFEITGTRSGRAGD
jgi:hypothetical protein